MKKYIGVDLGGTNVRCSIIDEEGKVLETVANESYAKEGPDKVLNNIYSLIRQLPDWDKCQGIGIGVPGPCDQASGSMFMSTNLPGFTAYPFAKSVTDELGLPAFIDNDANVAGLAEALVGAGKGLPIVYYVTISTGIGGALIVNGQCVSGKHGFAGEIANIIIDRNRQKINHLAAGAVENEASGTAIMRKAAEAFPESDFEHAGKVFELARQGNEKAIKLLDEAIDDLAHMFAAIAAVVDPDMFILGGGVMKSSEYLLPLLKEKFAAITHGALHDIPFVRAGLKEPGAIGAAMLPKSHGL